MPKAFLLHFQESCDVESILNPSLAIKTETKIAREGSKDQTCDSVYAIPTSQVGTTTRQQREGTDRSEDAFGWPGITVPMAAFEAVHIRKASPQKSTKTATAIRAETNDVDDDRHMAFHVIEPCS